MRKTTHLSDEPNVMFMKKISLLLAGMLVLFSCEQEELDRFVKNDVPIVQTRATSSIADFDPILELSDIPVNLLNVGNKEQQYLSCSKSGTEVSLFTSDDGSNRQRWFLPNKALALVGGHDMSSSGRYYVIAAPNSWMTQETPKSVSLLFLSKTPMPVLLPNFNFNYLSDGTYLISTPYLKNMMFTEYYLQSNTSTGSSIKFAMDNSNNLAKWQIAPVGEYELVDLNYVMTSVDKFTPTEVICDRDSYENTSSAPITWNYAVSVKYTESSSFSETEGVSVTITDGLSVGLPSVLGGLSVTVNTTIQQQTSQSWTYGTSATKEITKTRTANIQIPPHTNIRLEAVLFLYEGTVTYVATLRKIGDTKTFKVKGKWTGTSFSEFKAKTYDVSTGTLLSTSNLRE